MLKPSNLILFQGDSITDCERVRDDSKHANNPRGMGRGYPYLIASQLLAERPAEGLKFQNFGISGNRIVDLYARFREDALNWKPDVLSILIGVNDTWHEFMRQAGVPVPKYERVYRQLLVETKEALPEVKLVLCEPFLLRCGVVGDAWVPEVDQRRAVVRKLAREFNAVLVPFQEMFDAAVKQAPAEYWAGDGVHPTPAGHRLMATTWMKCVLR